VLPACDSQRLGEEHRAKSKRALMDRKIEFFLVREFAEKQKSRISHTMLIRL
jgi:hypothetical protein